MPNYQFTNNWFDQTALPIWRELFPNRYRPKNVLEIGSYEGKAACWLAQTLGDVHIDCVDTWEGSFEHSDIDMRATEERWFRNTELAYLQYKNASFTQWKGTLREQYCDIIELRPTPYDLIYIDGSHRAADVLSDAVLAWPLLRSGGVMIFDDYLWRYDHSAVNSPKLAIDSFVACYADQLTQLAVPASQVVVEKR